MMTQSKKIFFIFAFMICIIGILMFIPFQVSAEHIHDETCGYVEAVEGHPCQHVHDKLCGYIEEKQEIPCDQNCIDTNDDGIIDHIDNCAYSPAVKGHPCQHVHDDACGYIETIQGHPCQYQEQIQQYELESTADSAGTVSTFEELKDAIKNAPGTADNPTVISLGNNTITVSEGIFLKTHIIIENGTLQLEGTISGNYLFYVYAQSSMTLRNVTLNGNQNSVSYVMNQNAKLTLKDTIIENFQCNQAVLYCDGSGTPESVTYLESGTILRKNTVTQYNPYVRLQYSAKVYMNGASLEGPGSDNKNSAIYSSTTKAIDDLHVTNGSIKNFYSGIDSSAGTIIQNIEISDVTTGILARGAVGKVDFLDGIIQNCSFAGISLETESVLNMSGGTITNCTTDSKYLNTAGAIYSIASGSVNLTGGKIIQNVASGVYSRSEIVNISGSIELSGNKIGITTASTKELHLYGGKIINNEKGIYIEFTNPKVYLGGDIIIKDNTNGDLIIPDFNESENTIVLNKDLNSEAYISVTPSRTLTDNEEMRVAIADTAYHDGKLLGTEKDSFHSSESQYCIDTKDNQIVLVYTQDKTVQFVTQNSQTVENQIISSGHKVAEPTSVFKNGYELEGWYTSNDYLRKWDFSNDVVTTDLTLYAKWKPLVYNIDYILGGGTNSSLNPHQYTIETPDVILSEPTKDHYSFVGWTYEGQKVPVRNVTFSQGNTGDKTLTAHWEIEQLRVEFNTNGGSIIQGQTIDYNQKVTRPTNPYKTGYEFIGWYTSEQLTKLYDFSQPVTKSLTLYAKYTRLDMVEKPTSQISEKQVQKGTLIELSCATSGATIYYTLDGSVPTRTSMKYKNPIIVDKNITIQAIAVKDGMMDSEIARFDYTIITEGKVDVIIKVEGQGNISVDNQNDVLKAVLNESDYQAYQNGNDIIITLECQMIEGQEEVLDEQITSQYQVGKYLDISLYKQIGNQKREKVTELNQPLQLTIDVPNELLPDQNTKRIYSVLRLHGEEKNVLKDLDAQLETITIKTHKFSTYVILYKDITTSEKNENQSQSIMKTNDDYDLLVYVLLLTFSMVGIVEFKKKIRKD